MTQSETGSASALLVRDGEWATAATLADALGVTPRSIRSYVTALNARVPSGAADRVGSARLPRGRRMPRSALRSDGTTDAGTPRDRLHTLVRALLDAARRHRRVRDR